MFVFSSLNQNDWIEAKLYLVVTETINVQATYSTVQLHLNYLVKQNIYTFYFKIIFKNL
jgi:hypothetical protein